MSDRTELRVAVIVTTYNRPIALSWVLAGLSQQSRMPEQIVIADDGSGHETTALIEQWKTFYAKEFPATLLSHAWQADEGFRAAQARNRAVSLAMEVGRPDVVIFLDGDCIAPPWFIQNHLRLLSKGVLVAGGRGLLTPAFTEFLESNLCALGHDAIQASLGVFRSPYSLWRKENCDRYLSMLPMMSTWLLRIRDRRPTDDSLVRTCNLSVWQTDFVSAGGFDESFVGWGLEDTEFAVRLIDNGVRVRSGRFATNVFHLWHPERSREQIELNIRLLQQSRDRRSVIASQRVG